VVDERQRPGGRFVEGLLTPGLRRDDPSSLADDGYGNARRGAPGGVGELGSEALKLGLQLGDVPPRCAQLIRELLDLVARRCHRA
jgi:hypothetical protein